MKDNFQIFYRMEKENFCGKMEITIKDNLKMELLEEKVSFRQKIKHSKVFLMVKMLKEK